MTSLFQEAQLRIVFKTLLSRYGPQHWWPGDSSFEVMVGAVLTQNTAWSNVERAIDNLKTAELLSLDRMLAITEAELAQLIQPAGYFNIKARRLISLCRFIRDRGGERRLMGIPTQRFRSALLEVHGIGPETADDILLYAFERPVFVIDAYTRRLFSRLGMITGAEPYEVLRRGFEAGLGPDVNLFSEYHALIVRHAKQVCAGKPRCDRCPLATECVFHHG